MVNRSVSGGIAAPTGDRDAFGTFAMTNSARRSKGEGRAINIFASNLGKCNKKLQSFRNQPFRNNDHRNVFDKDMRN